MGFKNLVFSGFLTKKTEDLNSPNFRPFRNPDFRLTVMPFSLINCVYSYAIFCTWL